MICPVCKTNNTESKCAEFCVQCGSDLHVYHLLSGVAEKTQIKEEKSKLEQGLPKKTSSLFHVVQVVSGMVLLICVVFVIYIGMYFLRFMEHTEAHRRSISNKWSETGFEQLQQMNSIIKQELDLIMDQRRENQILQEKLENLSHQHSTLSVEKES